MQYKVVVLLYKSLLSCFLKSIQVLSAQGVSHHATWEIVGLFAETIF
jgi:hypothetical protein